MFNLENAIKEWRKQLDNHPGLEPGYVEELESHLRDRIEYFMDQGLTGEEAFKKASGKMDDAESLADEFHKSRSAAPVAPDWKNQPMFFHLLPNFLKVTLRNFRNNKGYSFINIAGLAVGLACCILIFRYVDFEMKFDRFHDRSDRIYRVVTEVHSPQSSEPNLFSANGWPVGRLLEQKYPEVEKTVYLRTYPDYSIEHEGRYYFEDMMHADENFLEVFSFPLISGNTETALEEPYSIVLTNKLKKKYFGSGAAVGENLVLNDSLNFTVTGVMKDPPRHSHIQFDLLISFSTLEVQMPRITENTGWFNLNMNNYILISREADISALEEKAYNLYMNETGERLKELGYEAYLMLEPIQDVYLKSDIGNPLGPSSDINYVYLLSAIGIFILFIACINFMNLATARSAERAREVGIRKVVGSSRQSLVAQFMTESLLTIVLSLLLSLGIVTWFLSSFNNLTQKQFIVSDFFSGDLLLYYLLFVVVVGILSGIYPALVLSGYQPLRVLKNFQSEARGGTALRKGLVVFQFTISCILIASTLVVLQQLRYMQNQDLGFNKDQVIVMDARQASSQTRSKRYETIKQELLRDPSVHSVTATLATPGRGGWRGQVAYPEGGSAEEAVNSEYLAVDHDYISTLGIEIIAGRDFSKQFQRDAENALIINERAVVDFGWETPDNAVGKKIESPSGYPEGMVIGVVENYHHHGLDQQISPVVMDINPGSFQFFAIRFKSDETTQVIDHIENVWNQFFTGYPFNYFFLDQDFARQYRDEQRLARIFGTFSTLAILIACLGLFGLAAFSARKRKKEIGIRKVLGASAWNVLSLMARDFLLLVSFAFLISGPIAYIAMSNWLQQFANRINLGFGIFLLTGSITLLIAIISVSWQSLHAALQNPVNSIRSEQ